MTATNAKMPVIGAGNKSRQQPQGYVVSLQSGWPMVETAVHRDRPPAARSSDVDEQAQDIARSIEARAGLPRTGGAPPSLDRDAARALVEAGYMPLADYIALYGGDMAVNQGFQRADFHETARVTGHFPVAFPRRQTYRLTSFRYTFAKPPPRSRRKA